ncbi:MAG: hypothetical protein M1822_000470 [Bathelium mastoideum]|nr:MAG: hypothetical protein M1822_000470 [Bathelium mastoideum]
MAPISVAPFALNPVPKTVSKDASITTMHELTVERKVGTKPTLTNGYQPVKTQTAPKTVINFRAPTPPPPTTVPTIPATVPVKGVTKVQPVPKTGTALVPKSAMHLTALGTQILSSSSKPVASVDPPHKAVLTKTASTSGPKTQNVAVPVISIPDSTAPSKQSHAQVWQAALKAAQTVSPVKVNNDVLHNPSIASADSNNKMFKVGLADLVRTKPEGSVTIQATAAPPLIVPTDVNKELLDKAPISAVSVHLPENLVKHVDTGSQPQKDITATTPPGFVLTGDPTKLFGFLEAERFTFHGNSSPDGKAEMMIPTTKDFTLDSLFGSDKVMLSGMKLGSPSISWYKTSTGKKKAGLWIDATLALSDKLQNLATDLKKVLGKDTPEIQVSGYLGQFTDWSTAPLPPDQLKLRGNIPDVSALLGKHIAFASVDVKCQALKGAQSQDGKQVYTWTYTLEGDLDLTVPGSVTPLSLKYNLAKSGNLYTLNMKLDKHNEWNNAMGVHGMHLVDVEVTNVFDKDKADGKEKFDLKAKFRTETTDLNITGSYEESDWSLSSTCPSLSWDQVDSLFNDMFGSRLQPFNHKISLNNLNLEASSAKKNISLDCQLTIDEHPVVDAEISLSSDGFHMSVKSLEDVTFGLVKVKKAAMEIFVGKVGDVNPDPKKPGTASFFTVKGEIEVGSIIVDATAYLDKDDPNSEAKWVLFAEYKNKLQLSSVSKLSGTSDILKELDFALEDVVVIAASTDKMNPDICAQIKYPIKQGIQLPCIEISKISNSKQDFLSPLKSMLRLHLPKLFALDPNA